MKLAEYIKENYSSKSEFARHQGVSGSQVYEWINKGFIVVGGTLYSPRRDLIK